MSIRNLIIGCGLSGIVLANKLATELKEKVLVIDRKGHIGGNIFDYKDGNGILVHKYGPHILHTNIKRVWDYLSLFTKWHKFSLEVNAFVDHKFINIPFNLNSLYKFFANDEAVDLEYELIKSYGHNSQISLFDLKNGTNIKIHTLSKVIYNKIYKNYTLKQWGRCLEEIDPATIERLPIYISRDNKYFKEIYQAIPLNGYTYMANKMLENSRIDVQLNTDFNNIKNKIKYDRLFCTCPIDEFFNFRFGELPYRSLHFDICEKKMEYFQKTAIITYPNNYKFTRICEHKHFLNTKSQNTTISYEYPEEFKLGKNERFYPINNSISNALYSRYVMYSQKKQNIFFLGRLGDYRYYNMDVAVERALKVFDMIKTL
jgi:UDP-galactopyranose mutase